MGVHNEFQDRFVELRQAMLLDGISFGLPILLSNDLAYLQQRCSKEGFGFVKVTLPTLGRAVDIGLVSGVFTCPTGIRKKKNTDLPLLLNGVFNTLFKEDGVLRDSCDPCTIQWLRQFLSFDSKLITEFTKEDLKKHEDKFANGQARLRDVRVPVTNSITMRCKRIISSIFEREVLDTFDLDPSHGPGSTADHKTFEYKYDFDTWPAKAERLFPYLQYGTIDIRYAIRAKPVALMHPCVTRACFVPKDYRGPRLISLEPAAMQFLQQGMMRRLATVLEHHFSTSVRLRDQTHNRRTAAKAVDRGFSTVDLSSASDTLSAVMVWHLFSGVANWRRALFSLRSDFVGFPTQKVKLVAMSPMGSAICFPVQTLVFTTIAIAVVIEVTGCSYVEAKRLVRVYGDDIIVPVGLCTNVLLSYLTQIGCEINERKTCYKTPFRESCGGEWYNDEDVSILRNKNFTYTAAINFSQHPSILVLQRGMFQAGYKHAASLLLKWANICYPTVVADPSRVSGDDSLFAFGLADDTSRGIFRFNKDYHRIEMKTPVVSPRRQAWRSGDELGLKAALISNSYSERFSTRDSNVKVEWRAIAGYRGVNHVFLA